MSETVSVNAKNLGYVLFGLRVTVFLVMIMWTIDKFLNPGHAAAVFGHFYMLPGLEATAFTLIGIVQAIVVIAFLVGFMKRWSTLAILIMHTISTLTPMANYFDPYTNPNLLFFAAWPMLAGCVALYVLRDHDTFMSLR